MSTDGVRIDTTKLSGNLINVVSNTAALSVTGGLNMKYGNTVYINVATLSVLRTDVSTTNIASANVVNTVYTYATVANATSISAIATAYTQGNTAFNKANTACTQSDSAGTQANLAYGRGNTAYTQGNTGYTQANAAYVQANTAYVQANAAFVKANTANAGAVNWFNAAGIISPFAGSVAPTGWLLCFGQSVSTTTYALLYNVIGYTYGGAGASMSIPDLRGRVVAGKDNMGGVSADRLTTPIDGDVLGASGGAESVTLTVAQMPTHTHFTASQTPTTTAGEGTHSHTWSGTVTGTVGSDSHSHQFSGDTASNTAGSGSGDRVTSLTSTTSGSQVRTTGSDTHNHTWTSSVVSGTVSGAGTHTHTMVIPASNSSSNGSSTSHTNIQPTIVLNYIIYAGV